MTYIGDAAIGFGVGAFFGSDIVAYAVDVFTSSVLDFVISSIVSCSIPYMSIIFHVLMLVYFLFEEYLLVQCFCI